MGLVGEQKTLNDGRVVLHHGDSRDVLRGLADSSIDSIVCDPPYALVSISKRFGKPGSAAAKHGTDGLYARASAGFMGKDWDVGETAFAETFWAECLRVLKPGGHVVAFGGTRTYHRLVCAIEDAGFEIRDRIRFEQSFDTKYGPLIDSLNDAQREALQNLLNDYCDNGSELAWEFGSGFPKSHNQDGEWQGYGSALKPAYEPICLARKPLVGTIAGNLAEHGTGALNIDGCRVEGESTVRIQGKAEIGFHGGNHAPGLATGSPEGRWPANIVHDGSDEVLAAFPVTGSNGTPKEATRTEGSVWNIGGERSSVPGGATYNDQGSAARFFYCAKASRADRDEGLDHLPKKAAGLVSETSGQHITRREADYVPPQRANIHPTVKPTDLMRWLCRLITPPGGTILDPFMGSGSTGKAAVLEGFGFVGIEREDEYMPIATARIEWAIEEAKRPVVAKPRQAKQRQAKAANSNVADLFGDAA